MSITRLDYFFKVLRKKYGFKATFSDADSFKERLKLVERRDKALLKRANSDGTNNTMVTGLSRSMSLASSVKNTSMGSSNGGITNYDDEDWESSKAKNQSTIIVKLNEVFDSLADEL